MPQASPAFAQTLLRWDSRKNKRQMPWKGEKDPYRIWLSEIILQQTRVEQGWDYYQKFIAAFPDIHSLARASDVKVFKCWEGLGYYSRCRNLLATARYISGQLGGRFPDSYEAIRGLKGVGPYTAAAIASFAYNLPHAVVDGNVYRVLARVFGIETPTDSTAGKKVFLALAADLLDKRKPGRYNQAIMDFGATICKPQPDCQSCPFQQTCKAYASGRISRLPVKAKKAAVRKRWFNYLVMEQAGRLALHQRTGKDIWQQLHEFPVIETKGEESPEAILDLALKQQWLIRKRYRLRSVSPVFRQQLSHQLIIARFLEVEISKTAALPEGFDPVEKRKLKRYAFPRVINDWLEVQQSD